MQETKFFFQNSLKREAFFLRSELAQYGQLGLLRQSFHSLKNEFQAIGQFSMTLQKVISEERESHLSTTKQLELEWGLGKKKLTCKRGLFFLFF